MTDVESSSSTTGETSQSRTDAIRLDVPDSVLRDERFVPRIIGLEPDQYVTLTAETSDSERRWVSTATFESDSDGVVDLSARAPVDGSYDRVDSMAPIWSMTVEDGTDARFRPDPSDPYEITYTAEADGQTTTATVEIRHAAPGVERHDVSASGIFGTWYEPSGDGPHSAVLLLHGSGGKTMRADAALLASRGFAAFALTYLGECDLPDSPLEVPLEYALDSISWFLDHDVVGDDSVGLYGASMGGQLALVLASRDDRVDAVVSDAGSSHVTGTAETTAWTHDGESIPHLSPPDEPRETYVSHVDDAPVLREASVQLLDSNSTASRKAATIPAEDAEAPILLLSGSDDQLWPATMFANVVVARLDALDYDYPYEHRAYHEAGHCVGTPYRPTTWRPAAGGAMKGGDPAAQASAQADAWPRVLEFFERHLTAKIDT